MKTEQLTTAEAALALGVSERRVRQLVDQHGLTRHWVGKKTYTLSRADVDGLKQRPKRPGPPKRKGGRR